MPSTLLSFFSGRLAGRRAVETIVPERTFDDVILPPTTRETLLFSASMPPPIKKLADRLLINPKYIEVDRTA